jgi:SAM-dependent methyltransferase
MIERYPYYAGRLYELPYGSFRRITRRKCRGYSEMEPFLANKDGLEIGGPSPFFCRNRLVPVYDRCRQIDSINFAGETLWNNTAARPDLGANFHTRYVTDACDLSVIPHETYDFVLASHVLEHIANPLRALQEFKRVLKPEGVMLIVVPEKRNTFDHRRPFTPFEHIEADFQSNTQEDDLTHLDEVLSLHDLRLDPEAGSREQFQDRCLRNSSFRAMHHHVYSPEVLGRMLQRFDMRVLSLHTERPFHIVGFAQKVRSHISN